MIDVRRHAGLLALAALALLAACADHGGYRPAPRDILPSDWVAVRLASGVDAAEIECAGAYRLVDGAGRVLRSGARLARTVAGARSRDVLWAGASLGALEIEVQPQGSSLLRVDGKPYRGTLRIQAGADGRLTVSNRLDVESYLRGVLPGEMPDRFGLAALKAQAVAARTYALAEMAQRGWLYRDAQSQVYGGADAETLLSGTAVAATEGQVLTANGRVFPAWFHSTCGGGTIPAADVYGAPPAGVLEVAVSCPDCASSPTFEWTRRVSAERVCTALGLPVAPLTSVRCEPARYPGRPAALHVVAGGRSASMALIAFRAKVSAGRPLGEQVLSTRLRSAPVVEGGDLVLHGGGFGHGVGLCQYGAAGYAGRGADYKLILRRYYVGATLVQLR